MLVEATAKCKDLQIVDDITILKDILVQKSHTHMNDIIKAHVAAFRSLMSIPRFLVDDFLERYDKNMDNGVKFQEQSIRLNGIKINLTYPYDEIMYSFYKK